MVLSGVVCMLYYTTQYNTTQTSMKEELQHKRRRGLEKTRFWFFLFYVLLYSMLSPGACGRCLFLFCDAKRIFFIFCMFFVFFCSVFFCFFLFFLFFLVFFGVFWYFFWFLFYGFWTGTFDVFWCFFDTFF